MGHVFISYAREDELMARLLADALAGHGHSVWWDRRIRAGRDFNAEIDAALDLAACVVVIWSEHSVDSTWVRAEATVGLERGILLPLRIDDARPSTVFRVLHTLPLRSSVTGLDEDDVVAVGLAVADFLSQSVHGAGPAGANVGGSEIEVSPTEEIRGPAIASQEDFATGLVIGPVLTSDGRPVVRLRVSVDQLELQDEVDPGRAARLVFSAREGQTARRAFVEVSLRMIEELLLHDLSAGLRSAGERRSPEIGLALFELLIPQQLKRLVADAEAIELELDGLAAVIPWETLIANGSDPLALEIPFVRRLLSLGLQRRKSAEAQWTAHALVLGNVGPKGAAPTLPGAVAEAKRLQTMLINRGFRVSAVIDESETDEADWRRIVRLLYSDVFDIMHVASLSTMWNDAGNSGLPIGQWTGSKAFVFLTGSMLGQLSNPPRFAMFNNGEDARVLPPSSDRIDESLLRDSLVYQLLAGGTEVFVGPIRHVDDVAGGTFADALYAALLRGDELGIAVLHARRQASAVASIYHCYGALDWTLASPDGTAAL